MVIRQNTPLSEKNLIYFFANFFCKSTQLERMGTWPSTAGVSVDKGVCNLGQLQ